MTAPCCLGVASVRIPSIEAEIYLQRFPIEKLFSISVRDKLIVHKILRGAYLFREDEARNRLYFIVEGRAKTYVMHRNGVESLISFLGPGMIMGDMELVGAQTEMYMVQAVEPCAAIELPIHDFRENVLQDAKFLRILCHEIANKLHKNDMRFTTMQAFPLKPRLAEFILLAQAGGEFSEQLIATAQYLGVSYRHLLRVLSEFCDEGVLKRGRGHYTIQDMKKIKDWMNDIQPYESSEGFLAFL